MPWPSTNILEIPDLPLSACPVGQIPDPVMGWGSVSRGRLQSFLGTLHFYVDDYRFLALAKQPDKLLKTGCSTVCELNLSLWDSSPTYEIVASIGRKRAISAGWAASGLRLLVDLCLPPRALDLGLLGVPHGWTHYATRAFPDRLAELRLEYSAAVRRAAPHRPTVLVVGGGAAARAVCADLPGTVWTSGRCKGFDEAATDPQVIDSATLLASPVTESNNG